MSLVSSKMMNIKDEKKWIVSTFLIALKEVVICSYYKKTKNNTEYKPTYEIEDLIELKDFL